MAHMNSRAAAASLAAVVMLAAAGAAEATNGRVPDGGTAGGTSGGTPGDITITGPDPDLPGLGEIVLDGDYVVAAGGTKATAVLGSVGFDPAGTVIGGTLTFIGVGGAEPEPDPLETTATSRATSTTVADDEDDLGGDDGLGGDDDLGGDDGLGGDDDFGDDDGLDDPGTSTATVTDCTVTGGTYSLAAGGGGEAQIELDCAGSSLPATWRIFVTQTQGLAVAQQFRAVQLETLPGAVDPEIVDLTLTLR